MNLTASKGDLHNFGKAVERQFLVNKFVYTKPRPVFWEWLFFGNSSPLIPIFEKLEIVQGLSFAQTIYGLKINLINEWLGHSEAIEQGPTIEIQARSAQFGALIAYCYFFGIYDLHHKNLVPATWGLQPIDCEIVFGNPILPNESLLLPFKDILFEHSGISTVLTRSELSDVDICNSIISNFIKTLLHINLHIEEIKSLIFSTAIQDHAIRIIFRNTERYLEFLNSRKELSPLLNSCEQEQLERGDVPYFFFHLKDHRVYYWADKEGSKKEAKTSDDFKATRERFLRSPDFLFEKQRVTSKLLPHGGLYLLKFLSGFCNSIAFKHSAYSFEANNTRLHIVCGEQEWVSTK